MVLLSCSFNVLTMLLKSEGFREMKITVKWWKTVKTETQSDLCGTRACNSHYFFFQKILPTCTPSPCNETCLIGLWWFVSPRISVGCLAFPVFFCFLFFIFIFIPFSWTRTQSRRFHPLMKTGKCTFRWVDVHGSFTSFVWTLGPFTLKP